MYSVRKATEEDYEILLEYGRHFAEEAKWVADLGYDPESVVPWLDMCRENGMLLVVEAAGYRVVGMAGAIAAPFYFNKDILQGVELFWWIKPEHRMAGAGRALMAGLESAAKERGVSRFSMVALASVEPEKAGAAYERAGYQLTELSYTKAM